MTEAPGVAIHFDRFGMQRDARRLLLDGRSVALEPRAFDLLAVLIERAGDSSGRTSYSRRSGRCAS